MHTGVWFKVFLSNTNNLHSIIWYQVFRSNTNNFSIVAWFLVFLSNTNMTNVLDCDIGVREIELQSWYYVSFRANSLEKKKPLSPEVIDLMVQLLLFFYKDDFVIKLAKKVDKSLKQRNQNLILRIIRFKVIIFIW